MKRIELIQFSRHGFELPGFIHSGAIEVSAPYKQGVWFGNSLHMVPWEEPGQTLQIGNVGVSDRSPSPLYRATEQAGRAPKYRHGPGKTFSIGVPS
jgi:hypothetical protein